MIVIGRSCTILVVLLAVMVACATAFQAPNPSFVPTRHYQPTTKTFSSSTTSLGVFNKKKKDEDLSFIESRDMTREEMEELNKQNEDIMQAELYGMTIFSLVISLPLLYLAWVAFFSETAEIAGDLSPYAQ